MSRYIIFTILKEELSSKNIVAVVIFLELVNELEGLEMVIINEDVKRICLIANSIAKRHLLTSYGALKCYIFRLYELSYNLIVRVIIFLVRSTERALTSTISQTDTALRMPDVALKDFEICTCPTE